VETAVKEADIPPEMDVQTDESNSMTTREVTQFAAYRQGQMVSICDLDMGSGEGNENMEIMLLGYVINGSKRLKVEIGPLVEWCIEYGNDPTLWTHTARAWYKILSPSKEYQKVHELARRRFELCSRLFILAVTIMPEQCTYKSLVSVLAAPYKQMKGTPSIPNPLLGTTSCLTFGENARLSRMRRRLLGEGDPYGKQLHSGPSRLSG